MAADEILLPQVIISTAQLAGIMVMSLHCPEAELPMSDIGEYVGGRLVHKP
jgi:hypothetical protein